MRAKGIVLLLILNLVLPMSSIAEERPNFEVTFFDKNADGIDDRMDHLMLNGEDDYLVPKSSALTLYNFSGTSEENKKIIFYNSGHWPLPRNQMIKESLATLEEFTLK